LIGVNCLEFLLFNVSHWIFAFKYFSITRQMPFKLVNLKVPRSILICDRLNNVVFLRLNSIAPITTAAFHITELILEYPDLPDDVLLELCLKIGNISCIANLSLPLITALYLFVALYFIKKQGRKKFIK
jgi:hypothetical protein